MLHFVFLVWTSLVVDLIAANPRFKGVPAPSVTTPAGRLKGKYIETRDGRIVDAFLGIPFAKPPVGKLRFEPPKPMDPWPHERLAITQPPPCEQIVDLRGKEDCLFLNVYTPDSHTENSYPVIVFFYGGAFEVGAAYGYTAEYFLDHDVVYVTVQYRLGLFGFLSTGDEIVPGNMGLKDQRFALRWIQKNIRSFGGDPSRVTIHGQSAGAASVHYLMLFAAHEGLFWAGISQSGTAMLPWAFHPPVEVRKMVKALAQLSGCPEDSVGFVECLRDRPSFELLILYDTLYKGSMYNDVELLASQFLPIIGGVIEPECAEDRLVTGNPWEYNTTIPWLVGVNSKEILFVLTADVNDRTGVLFFIGNLVFDYYFPLALNYQNSIADGSLVPHHIREYYLDYLPISRLTLSQTVDGVTDGVFIYGTYEAVMRASKNHTYLYFLDYVGANEIFPIPPDARVGASHADELFFFFPQPATPFPDRQVYTDVRDNRLSKKLVTLWTNFATCRDPTPSESCDFQWEPFFPNNRFLNITPHGKFHMQQDFLTDRMGFWINQPVPYRNDSYEVPPCRGPYTTENFTMESDYISEMALELNNIPANIEKAMAFMKTFEPGTSSIADFEDMFQTVDTTPILAPDLDPSD